VHAPSLSVVIPTHKRADILARCLAQLEKQTVARDLEVIVVSDGHDRATAELMAHVAETQGGPSASLRRLRFLEIPKSHQGIARNRGTELATAPVCLFIGDDILLEPDACACHLAAHRADDPAAVLGFTTWDPALDVNAVMRWLETSGWQFGYPLIARYAGAKIPQDIQHRFSYTSNLSLPRAIARELRFREDVSLYGWEDIEWGMRLREAGVPLFYEPHAKGFHHHHLSLRDSLRRMETIGASAVHLSRVAPSLDRTPKGWKLAAYYAISLLPTLRGQHTRAFLRGMRAA
jgi:GT2 family glycosyltransferase